MPRAKTEKPVEKKIAEKPKKTGGLSIPVYSLDGKQAGEMALPKEIFGAKVNKMLLSQAVRVYSNNLKSHFSNTKTRSEVKGSTRKIYKQKGTGGARHGAKTAPIFVGGGIALGPKFRKVVLDLPGKMKRSALISALSARALEGEIFGVKGLEKASGKTAQMRDFLKKTGKEKALFVLGDKNENTVRALRNLSGVSVLLFDQVNVLEVIKHKSLIFATGAAEKLAERVNK